MIKPWEWSSYLLFYRRWKIASDHVGTWSCSQLFDVKVWEVFLRPGPGWFTCRAVKNREEALDGGTPKEIRLFALDPGAMRESPVKPSWLLLQVFAAPPSPELSINRVLLRCSQFPQSLSFLPVSYLSCVLPQRKTNHIGSRLLGDPLPSSRRMWGGPKPPSPACTVWDSGCWPTQHAWLRCCRTAFGCWVADSRCCVLGLR